MDPLSIASAIVSFIDAGQKIKASIDKVANNNKRLQEVSDSVRCSLNDLQSLCNVHMDTIGDAELFAPLNSLTSTLLQVDEQCTAVLGSSETRCISRMKNKAKAWFKADQIEGDILQLERQIQSCLARFNAVVIARSEIAIRRLEHSVLVSQVQQRANMRQLNKAFGRMVARNGFGKILASSQDGDIPMQYLHSNLVFITNTLATLDISRFTTDKWWCNHWAHFTYEGTVQEAISQSWTVIIYLCESSSCNGLMYLSDNIRHLAFLVQILGQDDVCDDLISLLQRWAKLLSTVCRRLTGSFWKRQGLSHLAFTLLQLTRLVRSHEETLYYAAECFKLSRLAIRGTNFRGPVSTLQSLASIYTGCGESERAMACWEEDVGARVPGEIYGDLIGRRLVPCALLDDGEFLFAEGTRTSPYSTWKTASALHGMARCLSSLGRYAEAHIAGRNALNITVALPADPTGIPGTYSDIYDIDDYHDLLCSLWADLPTWIGIPRNISSHESRITRPSIKEVDEEDG